MVTENVINISKRLHSIEKDVNVLAGADEVFDDAKNKRQSEINVDVDQALDTLQTQITEETSNREQSETALETELKEYTDAEQTRAEAAEQALQNNINTEQSRAGAAEQTLQNNISTEQSRAEAAEQTLQNNINTEQSRAEAVEQSLRETYAGLTQTDIEVVATLPNQGVQNKIYRLVGITTFSDYQFNASDLSTPILLATYDVSMLEAQNGYYECQSAENASDKAITANGFAMPTVGGSLKVKMINKNTANNVRLVINSDTVNAKAIFYNGSAVNATNTWEAGETVIIYFDGIQWQAFNVAGGAGDGVFDISEYNAISNTPATYDNLTVALGTNGGNVPEGMRTGGMSVKYIENVYADYEVVVTEGLEEEPTGTELANASSVTSGTYKATQLTDFLPLPSNVGDSLIYYIAVVGDTTTYTQWLITKKTADHTKYVQWRYLRESILDADFSNINNWVDGYIDERVVELEKAAGPVRTLSYPFTGPKYYIKQDGSVATNNNFRSTGYIEVNEGDTFYYSGATSTTSRAVSAYRFDGTNYIFVAHLLGTSGNNSYFNSKLIIIPQGLGITHILSTYILSSSSTASLLQQVSSTLEKINNALGDVGNIKAYIDSDRTVFPIGHYVKDPNGTWMSSSFTITGFFDLKAGDKLTMYDYRANSSSSVAILAKKITDTPTFEILIGGDQVAHPLIEYVATEDMTVCVSGYYGPRLLTIESSLFAGINGSIDYLKTAQLQNEQKFDEIDKYDLKLGFMFNSIAVIGDSMSVGSISTQEVEEPNSKMNASWLSILAKRWGCISRKHYAIGGSSCYSWLNSNAAWGLGALLRDTDDAEGHVPLIFSCYFIAHGHNDGGSNYSGVGEATDPAATVMIDQETGAPSCESGSSFCAYYKAVIDQIRTKAPHAMIFCMSEYDGVVKTKQNGAYRQAIIDIADWYYAQGYHQVYHLETGGVPDRKMSLGSHYSTIGYFHIAMRTDQEANKVIYEHRDDMLIKEFGIYNNESNRYLQYDTSTSFTQE